MSDHNPLPGTGSIADSVEFVKKLWGIPSAGAMPGMLIPTLSLDEINKKIADLKAVESWMAVNMNMLRGTIQALEVQSATIINLQSMGAMMGAQPGDSKEPSFAGASTPAFPFSFPGWPPAAAATEAEAKPAAASAQMFTPAPPPSAAPTPEPSPVAAAPVEPATPARESASADAGTIAAGANAWWDMLQNQFKQAVGTALMPDALKPAPAKARTKPTASGVAATKAAPAARKTSAKKVGNPAVRKAPVRAKSKTTARPAKKS